jgi:cystathionine beta-synthase
LPDGGFRYLNKIYDDRWMQDHGFMEKEHALTADDVAGKGASENGRQVISVAPDATVAEAVECMTENAVSQVPVIKDGEVLGCLEEAGILHLLVDEPEARSRLVQDVMGPPPKVVESSLSANELSAHLEQPPGAVLIAADAPGSYRIITKTDLIAALARHNGT